MKLEVRSQRIAGRFSFLLIMSRKAFNFYRSYYDVAKELPEKERLSFLWAIIQKQFDGINPNLSGISKFAYISQEHSINMQVSGYEAKTGIKLEPTEPPCQGSNKPPTEPPSVQEKGKGQEKGKYPELHSEEAFNGFWNYYDKKADKKKCFEAWKKNITPENVAHVRSSLILYIKSTPDKKFRKNPLTWINGNCWLDFDINAKPELARDMQPKTLDY